MRLPILILLCLLLLPVPALGQAAAADSPAPAMDHADSHAGGHGDGHQDGHAGHGEGPAATPQAPAPDAPPALTPVTAASVGAAVPPSVGVTERLGDFIPESVMLVDEDGRPVRLRDLFTVPTLLAPVYYSCPNDCNLLLMNLSKVLPQVGLAPGREFQVLTVTFDERDTPELASRRRKDFGQALRGGFPIEHWRFLTGDKANIDALMGAIGFSFQRTGDAFQHSVIMAAVSPGGKITRYLYGASPLPFDIAMAATEAAEGRTGLSVSRAVAFCYSYDPQGRRYVFDITRVAGATVLFGIFLFALFLAFGGRKRRRAGKDGTGAA